MTFNSKTVAILTAAYGRQPEYSGDGTPWGEQTHLFGPTGCWLAGGYRHTENRDNVTCYDCADRNGLKRKPRPKRSGVLKYRGGPGWLHTAEGQAWLASEEGRAWLAREWLLAEEIDADIDADIAFQREEERDRRYPRRLPLEAAEEAAHKWWTRKTPEGRRWLGEAQAIMAMRTRLPAKVFWSLTEEQLAAADAAAVTRYRRNLQHKLQATQDKEN